MLVTGYQQLIDNSYCSLFYRDQTHLRYSVSYIFALLMSRWHNNVE